MKFKRPLALETIYLWNTIPPACLINQHPQINTIAPRDQFQRIQISAELKQWLLTIIHHYSLFVTIHCSLFANICCSLFAIRDYSLFAIQVFQTPYVYMQNETFSHGLYACTIHDCALSQNLTRQQRPRLSLKSAMHKICFTWVYLIRPLSYGWTYPLLIQFTD